MLRIVELDFGMGNIRSLQKAFEHLGFPVTVSDSADQVNKADILLLPGDGAFGKAISELKSRKLYSTVEKFLHSGKPVLGICIGFQILFSTSEEFGSHEGFGFFPGHISRFPLHTAQGDKYPVPHMGWSQIKFERKSPLFDRITDHYFYFVHSYRYSGVHENALASGEYTDIFTAIVQKGNVFAVQFHPEKSHTTGLSLLKNFMNIAEKLV